MKMRIQYSYRYIKILMACILFAIPVFANAQEIKLMAIGNVKGCPSEMKFQELKSILRGEKQRWNDGTKIVIALMKSNTATGISSSQKVYGMTPDELNKYWLALVFQGKAQAPSFFNSVSDLESFVARTPGAIGITEGSEQSTSKPVLIDGKKMF